MQLHIKNLHFTAVIGIHDWEQARRRQFRMNITLDYDATQAIAGDDFSHAIDYGKVEQRMVALADSRRWNLIETLADTAASCLLNEFLALREVSVTVEKPQAMHFSESVSATVHKKR